LDQVKGFLFGSRLVEILAAAMASPTLFNVSPTVELRTFLEESVCFGISFGVFARPQGWLLGILAFSLY